MERIIWTKDMLRELLKVEVRHDFHVAGIVACRVNETESGPRHQLGIAWRENWEDYQEIFFSNLASQHSPLALFKIFLRSLGRRRKSADHNP